MVDVELNNVNGGSYRVYIRNRTADRSTFGDEACRQQASDLCARYSVDPVEAWNWR